MTLEISNMSSKFPNILPKYLIQGVWSWCGGETRPAGSAPWRSSGLVSSLLLNINTIITILTKIIIGWSHWSYWWQQGPGGLRHPQHSSGHHRGTGWIFVITSPSSSSPSSSSSSSTLIIMRAGCEKMRNSGWNSQLLWKRSWRVRQVPWEDSVQVATEVMVMVMTMMMMMVIVT